MKSYGNDARFWSHVAEGLEIEKLLSAAKSAPECESQSPESVRRASKSPDYAIFYPTQTFVNSDPRNSTVRCEEIVS
jgi:hypothetical protein